MSHEPVGVITREHNRTHGVIDIGASDKCVEVARNIAAEFPPRGPPPIRPISTRPICSTAMPGVLESIVDIGPALSLIRIRPLT